MARARIGCLGAMAPAVTGLPDVHQSDAHKMAVRLHGGMLPQAYVYPAKMRATRDLLRRRRHRRRRRAERLTHVQQTNCQYNLPEIGKKIAYKATRMGVAARFADPAVPKSIKVDLALIDHDDRVLNDLAWSMLNTSTRPNRMMHTLCPYSRRCPGLGKS